MTDQRWRTLNREQRNHNRKLKGLPPLAIKLDVPKVKVAKALKGTDVGYLQGLMQKQLFVTDSARFRVDPNGSQVTILDTITRRKTVVPLFAAANTIKALEELFG